MPLLVATLHKMDLGALIVNVAMSYSATLNFFFLSIIWGLQSLGIRAKRGARFRLVPKHCTRIKWSHSSFVFSIHNWFSLSPAANTLTTLRAQLLHQLTRKDFLSN
jgi:hypothetical protein